jgi:excinuclease ABC subunit B
MKFKLVSDFEPTGDQPTAIKQLVEGANRGDKAQVLLGVTGSGKTFTVANLIKETQRPALILSHNKTLAAQLYSEFKQFFPDNLVEYFVSYYDYYQPEAFIPSSNTYIEKDLSINDEIEKLRLSTVSALLSGRRDVIVVSSVSCIYGMGNPDNIKENTVKIKKGQILTRNKFLHQLVSALYSRTENEFRNGTFRVKGDTVDVYIGSADIAYRVYFFGDEIEMIEHIDPISGTLVHELDSITIYPATIYVAGKSGMKEIIWEIQEDMVKQVEFFKSEEKFLEAKRLEDRVTYDLEMIREIGYCSGIENYSRYFDGRLQGTRPFCLLDYFPDDFLMVIDESHVTIPQIKAMYGGDRSRKINLVEYGFRLPAAMDNRPLMFDEFNSLTNQIIYVSATPADYELNESGGFIVEQLIRPTGLLDPVIEVRPSLNQIDDLLDEVDRVIKNDERVLVTTLTKRMAEELSKYMAKLQIRCRYIHSDVDTLERIEILGDLRLGKFDVLIGVNLLREGLDLPEVSLVAILDADKEGFLRSQRSLVQTVGRAARNVNGKVVMYADKMTDSMARTIDETNRRREKQIKYNLEHDITPTQIKKNLHGVFDEMGGLSKTGSGAVAAEKKAYTANLSVNIAADPVVDYMNKEQLQKLIIQTRKKMEKAAKDMDFMEAARLRDEVAELEKLMSSKFK